MVVLCHADKTVTGRTDDLVEVLIGDSMLHYRLCCAVLQQSTWEDFRRRAVGKVDKIVQR